MERTAAELAAAAGPAQPSAGSPTSGEPPAVRRRNSVRAHTAYGGVRMAISILTVLALLTLALVALIALAGFGHRPVDALIGVFIYIPVVALGILATGGVLQALLDIADRTVAQQPLDDD